MFIRLLLTCLTLAMLSGCSQTPPPEKGSNAQGNTSPTIVTINANKAVLENRPFTNLEDFEDANRGLIASSDNLVIVNKRNDIVWNMPAYDFINSNSKKTAAPSSVNPSLWRQASLNNIHGLFKVSENIYQLRGFDLANMTIIVGESGWILVDPLTAMETASAALKFAQQHLGKQPIRAILYTHSHIDHFGGIEGIIENLSQAEIKALRIIAPKGFMAEATSENIIAGLAMGRRAGYMYGRSLEKNIRGHIGTGLGKGPAFGTFALLEPTELITHTGQKLSIDGLDFEFQFVPGSEAPAEFTFYLPAFKAFCGAEMLSRNLHNLYTLRGAKVRDAKIWSAYIDEAQEIFSDSEVYFASHHWPMWGRDKIQHFLGQQSDTYKYIHDQSVRLFNAGYTPNEIAEEISLPANLNTAFYNQGYYGTVKHNAKAVYQMYLGWYTANPAALDPLPEAESAKRYIEMMGGIDTLLKKAQVEFSDADTQNYKDGIKTYRWLAELLNHAVFAAPNNQQVKQLLAKVYDQLGYQAESAPWRDVYLSGAHELRHGTPANGISASIMENILLKTPVSNFFDSMSVRLNGPKAAGKSLSIKITFTDLDQSYLLSLHNAVLRHKRVSKDTQADATLTLTKSMFVNVIIGKANLKEMMFSDDLSIDGSKLDLIAFFGLLDKSTAAFNIVTP